MRKHYTNVSSKLWFSDTVVVTIRSRRKIGGRATNSFGAFFFKSCFIFLDALILTHKSLHCFGVNSIAMTSENYLATATHESWRSWFVTSPSPTTIVFQKQPPSHVFMIYRSSSLFFSLIFALFFRHGRHWLIISEKSNKKINFTISLFSF